jgi:hypothetical protein
LDVEAALIPSKVGPVTAGSYIYVVSDISGFQAFFGFDPDFQASAASINGDDAIELFQNGAVVDVFGDAGVDGTGQPWEYRDGWAYRNNGLTASQTFTVEGWFFSGPDALDGASTNAGASAPSPLGLLLVAAMGLSPAPPLLRNHPPPLQSSHSSRRFKDLVYPVPLLAAL